MDGHLRPTLLDGFGGVDLIITEWQGLHEPHYEDIGLVASAKFTQPCM